CLPGWRGPPLLVSHQLRPALPLRPARPPPPPAFRAPDPRWAARLPRSRHLRARGSLPARGQRQPPRHDRRRSAVRDGALEQAEALPGDRAAIRALLAAPRPAARPPGLRRPRRRRGLLTP